MLMANMHTMNPLTYNTPLVLSSTPCPMMHKLANTNKLASKNRGRRRPSELTQLSHNFPITGSQNFDAPYIITQMPSMCACARGNMTLISTGKMTCRQK